jgi:hypothetical protein
MIEFVVNFPGKNITKMMRYLNISPVCLFNNLKFLVDNGFIEKEQKKRDCLLYPTEQSFKEVKILCVSQLLKAIEKPVVKGEKNAQMPKLQS